MLHFLFISCSPAWRSYGWKKSSAYCATFTQVQPFVFPFRLGTNTHVLWSVHRNWTLQLLCPSGRCSGNGPSRPWSCSPRRKCLWSDGCSKVWWFSSGPPVRRCPVGSKRRSLDKNGGLTLWVIRYFLSALVTVCMCPTVPIGDWL